MTSLLHNAISDADVADQLRRAAGRIMQRCDALAQCTDTPGQLTRLFCSPAMQQAHERLRTWMEAAGMNCRIDPAGNLIGRLRADGDPAIHADSSSSTPSRVLLIGSHLDTVVNAGKYDGPLGVLLGLALAEVLKETNVKLPLALDVIGFCEEEGVRYHLPYIGSRAMIGDLPADLLQQCDHAGIPLATAIRSFGGDPDQLSAAVYQSDRVLAFIEPHIEQGPVLELENLPVGVVSGIAGQTRACFQFVGKAGHAGTVPMTARHDALAAAAEFICKIESFARNRPGLVATVGRIDVEPNVPNVIAGDVEVRLDVRHLNDDQREASFREITHLAAIIAQERDLEFDLLWSHHHSAVKCDVEMTNRLAVAVNDSGVRSFHLPSGAGHDAAIMARKFPTAMLFVRCRAGVSHHPDESATEADVTVALAVLYRLVISLAQSLPPAPNS